MAEVNPAGETGQASNKRKAKKLEGDGAKKRPNLKLDLSKIKNVRSMVIQTQDTHAGPIPRTRDLKKNYTDPG